MLKEEILSDRAFQFSPELLKRLAPQHWDEAMWGGSYEFNLNDRVLGIQQMVLARMMDPQVLKSIQNAETHATEGQEVLKLPEVFDTLTDAVFEGIAGSERIGRREEEDRVFEPAAKLATGLSGSAVDHRAGTEA